MLDIKRLKELAMGATDGPWFLTPNFGMKITKDRETICAFAYQDFDGEHYNCVNEAHNAVFIGSCDPRTILDLIKRVEDAEAAVKDNKKTQKMFPIFSRPGDSPHPSKVPWHIADIAYASYKTVYGTNQSLERLAERGGFSQKEMDHFYPAWQKHCKEGARDKEKIEELKAMLQQHHDWHQQPDLEMKLGDDYYDAASCYVDSTFEEETTRALSL